jgi:hypothetical protein
MGQSSVLVVHPRTTPLVLLRCLLGLPDLDRSVKIPNAVKASIIHILRSYRHEWHRLGNGMESLRNSTSDTILTWHIATCILELDNPAYQDGQEQGFPPDLNHKVTATHLSRYCTYPGPQICFQMMMNGARASMRLSTLSVPSWGSMH